MAELPIGEALRLLALRDPDAVAVVHGGVRTTRADLVERAQRWARRWVADGLEPDGVVAVALPNSADLVVACAAAWTAGATPLPLPATLPASERDELVGRAGAAVVVAEPLGASGPAPAFAPRPAAASWKISPSSGSTGPPKLIRAGGGAVVDPDRPVTSFLAPGQVQLVSGPLAHAAPFAYAMRGLMTGHTLVLMDRPDPAEWLHLVAAERVTWALLVPATMRGIWCAPDRAVADVSSLRTVVHLGAACPEPLKRDWLGWLGPERVVEVYAGTESQGLSVIDGREWLAHPGSVGRGAGGTTYRIVRDDGSDCAPGERGEVLMRRERSASSYLDSPAADRDDGWHSLGDLGHLDAVGYLYLHGRLDDAVVTGGTTVLPGPVEAALEEHPRVRSALVVGRPDADLVARIHAVVDDAGAGLSAGELATWLDERVDRAAMPRTWEVVDRPLRDDAGKARRRDWRS